MPNLNNIRQAVHINKFYPQGQDLIDLLGYLWFRAKLSAGKYRNIKALIVPHAGYIFSGLVAIHAYKALFYDLVKQKKSDTTYVLLGSAHYLPVSIATGNHSAWQAVVRHKPISCNLKSTTLLKDRIEMNNQAIEADHILETQIPFLEYIYQKLGQNHKWQILPILEGENRYEEIQDLLQKLNDEDQQLIFIISSDLSHYLPLNEAKKIDKQTIKSIQALNLKGLIEACSANPIKALLGLAKQNKWQPTLLKYQTSAEVTKDQNQVVGYASFIFTK